jgi:tRNA-intron endonuclease, archaea type
MSSSYSSSAQPFSNSKVVETEIPLIEACLAEDGEILINETKFQDVLRSKGFGEREDVNYVLKPYEALYLVHTKRLTFRDMAEMNFNLLFEKLLKYDRNIMTKFLVYRDLRSRGYVAKEGFGFGNDFRVYERGEYEKKPAKYIVFDVNEGTNTSAKSFSNAIGQIEKMGKEAVVAVIERRGEVIYYKAAKLHFVQNKYHQNNQ